MHLTKHSRFWLGALCTPGRRVSVGRRLKQRRFDAAGSASGGENAAPQPGVPHRIRVDPGARCRRHHRDFTLVDAVLLHPLRIPGVDRVFDLQTTNFRGEPYAGFLYRQYRDIRDSIGDAISLAVGSPTTSSSESSGASRGAAASSSVRRISTCCSGGLCGRTFVDEDDRPGAEPVAILGYDLWRSAFGADEGIVGRPLRISGAAMTVVGVAAPRERGTNLQDPAEIFCPRTRS